MPKAAAPSEHDSMTVYRPRRKCTRCGLVNADFATKCRRCGQSFASIDPADESQRLVARIRARRFTIAAVVITVLAGLAFVGVSYRARLDRLSRYTERARAVEAELTTLSRGATADAKQMTAALDDEELLRLLRDQAGVWTSRVDQTEAIEEQLTDLLPQNEDQTAHELGLERQLGVVATSSRELASAARDGDVFRARIAAARLVDGEP
jgi:hypothetical protein